MAINRPSVAIISGFAVFVAILVYLVVAGTARRTALMFDPTTLAAATYWGDTLVHDTITIDATNESQWTFVDLDSRVVVVPPDTAGWDLAFRRFYMAVATTHRALQGAEFSTVTRAPAGGYAAASEVDPLATPIRWYRYSMITHLLKPSGAVFVVRTTQGNYAKLELLSYYCTEMRPGCITLRYAYQGATGVDLLE